MYTDGACLGNPGPGGYGVVLMYDGHRKELSGGFRLTTNNRMELMAAIVGLEALTDPCQVRLYSDSRYVVENYNTGAVRRWQANGWKRSKKLAAQNVDLWERLLRQCQKHRVEMIWVEGHAGNPENERCDVLSNQAARRKDLPPDEAYEQGITRDSSTRLF
ncbi:RNase HI [Anaerolinea thermolimosa]|uniref:ribonuclease HI n=1 Tax=Anaerolinea thermolimosa TaxID=229919 RepID=UPI0013B410DF|nr:ribonuclease HI [Anaerolinea thermolimosa]GAP05960.1 RNase HI [Anaerolinea thermolimosa]